MRILFMANAPWVKSGYGMQGQYLANGWKELGHEVFYFSYWGLAGSVLHWQGIPVLPAGIDPWGNDIVGFHCRAVNAEALITLMDIWVQEYFGQIGGVAWCPWMPIDHDPAPPIVISKMYGARRVITYARFGQRMCRQAGVDADYIPHGVDLDVFHPGDKAEAREKVGLPAEAFIAALVGTNKGFPSRKALVEQITAFAAFARRHKEAALYLHMVPSDVRGGVDLAPLIRHLGIDDGRVYFCDQYRYITGGFPNQYMADVYRSADVLLGASRSEGFGIPILEAQACGCPVITTDFTAMPELTWFGRTVEPAQLAWTQLASWIATPSIPGIAAALEEIYGMSREDYEAGARLGVERAAEYAWPVLLEGYWRPFLQELQEELAGDRPSKLEWPMSRNDWEAHVFQGRPLPTEEELAERALARELVEEQADA